MTMFGRVSIVYQIDFSTGMTDLIHQNEIHDSRAWQARGWSSNLNLGRDDPINCTSTEAVVSKRTKIRYFLFFYLSVQLAILITGTGMWHQDRHRWDCAVVAYSSSQATAIK